MGANSRLGAYSNKYGEPVFEEAKIMVYITAGDDDFQNIQNGGQEKVRVLTEILIYSRFVATCILSSRYHELRNTPKAGKSHSCAIILSLSRTL